jgi:ferredoxin
VTRRLELRVDASRCTRCGACSALCPTVFDVRAGPCRITRQPLEAERLYAEAARRICPTDSIHASSAGAVRDPEDDAARPGHRQERVAHHEEPTPPWEASAPLFDELAAGAEAVRWSLADLPWNEFDGATAPAELRAVVREMAFSENATYSATQRFLEAFCDDVDFSRWVSIWFYEETRHPYVLMEWLRLAGEPTPADFVLRGRVSTPFMRSTLGTLVTNVVSEITAAQAYRLLARGSPEPALRGLASRIAGDEARHAASFFRFARSHLARTPGDAALRERVRGLEVLHAWLDASHHVTHPVQQMVERLDASRLTTSFGLDFASTRLRVVRVVGLLLEVPLRAAEDVEPALRDLLRPRGSQG